MIAPLVRFTHEFSPGCRNYIPKTACVEIPGPNNRINNQIIENKLTR